MKWSYTGNIYIHVWLIYIHVHNRYIPLHIYIYLNIYTNTKSEKIFHDNIIFLSHPEEDFHELVISFVQ